MNRGHLSSPRMRPAAAGASSRRRSWILKVAMGLSMSAAFFVALLLLDALPGFITPAQVQERTVADNLPEPPDINLLQEQLKDVESINEGIRNNKAYKKAEAERDNLKEKSDSLSKQIAEIDKQKSDALTAAKLPVKELSFDEHGLIYDNAPFEQAATSAKIRVAFALQVAKNPKLRVALIRDYQFFDQENRKLIRELARKHNFQVWCEMVDPQQEPGVIIEDGMIKEIVKKPQEPKREEEAKEPVQQNLTALDQVAGEFE